MKKLIAILIFITLSVIVKADNHISLWLCHNAKNEIVSFNNKHFKLQFIKNKAVSFMTQDSFVYYDIKNKSFAFKSPLGDEIKLYFQNKILMAKYRDTIIDIENYLKINFKNRARTSDGYIHDTIIIGGLSLDVKNFPRYKKGVFEYISVQGLSIKSSTNTKSTIEYSSFYYNKKDKDISSITCKINDSLNTYISFHYHNNNLSWITIYDNYNMHFNQNNYYRINGIRVSIDFKRNEKLYAVEKLYYNTIDLPKRVRWDEYSDFYQVCYTVAYFRYNYRGRIKSRRMIGKINYCDAIAD